MAREKMKRKQAVIERQEEELESREQSLEGAAAHSQHASEAAEQLLQESKTIKVRCRGGGRGFQEGGHDRRRHGRDQGRSLFSLACMPSFANMCHQNQKFAVQVSLVVC